eukprot:4462232-Amphidinium_carterae.1
MVKLAEHVDIPIGWSDLAVTIFVGSFSDDTTHHEPPFMIETMTQPHLRCEVQAKRRQSHPRK